MSVKDSVIPSKDEKPWCRISKVLLEDTVKLLIDGFEVLVFRVVILNKSRVLRETEKVMGPPSNQNASGTKRRLRRKIRSLKGNKRESGDLKNGKKESVQGNCRRRKNGGQEVKNIGLGRASTQKRGTEEKDQRDGNLETNIQPAGLLS